MNFMTKTTLALLATSGLAAALISPLANAAHPSFDCAKATHEAEQLICKDAELAELDQRLAELYATLMKHTPASQQGALKTEQRGWVKGRNDCWKSDDQRGCIKAEYRSRIKELKDR
ncbi:lysozyme inhibitor LprI family protein [Thiocystis violascens]|uniref:Lysozyme inhibitor LprI-like N-terminal domain-containing protein n=1 Tax=Thiocystis violascens (strain ATCC 17096 / DSM 198 / 6111) TaxID=765911 RepID=I3YGI5_THIV6|nr:lysozyme inhibitor LprI family protein [Thiocystis violascens]AFL76103.1 hypothetical protein Thivi_4290 [Thiocystis violascens DSM 198]